MARARGLLIAIVTGFLFVSTGAWATPTAHLIMQSEPGDYIGGGIYRDLTYTPQNSPYIIARFLPTDHPQYDYVQFLLGSSGDTSANLSFSTRQLGILLQPGFYSDARRAPFAPPGHPGLEVSFYSRCSNQVFGNFTIEELTLTSSGELNIFQVSFEQHSESAQAPALYGTFRYDRDPVPEPASLMLIVSGLAGLAGFRKFKR